MLVGGAEARTAARISDIVETDVALFVGHISQLFTEHRRKADFSRRFKNAFVNLLAPKPHLRAVVG
jgi:hypothetical protein